MPEFDLDKALDVPVNIPTGAFTHYHYAVPGTRDWYHCQAFTGHDGPFRMGVICDDTANVIIQLLSGRYFTAYGVEEYETAVFEDAIQWLRQHHQEEQRQRHA